MARKSYSTTLSHFLPLILVLLSFLLQNNPVSATNMRDREAEAPSPSPTPQPQQSTNTSTFPMHEVTPGSLKPQECGSRCGTRCSRTAYKKPCMFFCQKCRAKCLCVPRGTYVNKETCPCYNN